MDDGILRMLASSTTLTHHRRCEEMFWNARRRSRTHTYCERWCGAGEHFLPGHVCLWLPVLHTGPSTKRLNQWKDPFFSQFISFSENEKWYWPAFLWRLLDFKVGDAFRKRERNKKKKKTLAQQQISSFPVAVSSRRAFGSPFFVWVGFFPSDSHSHAQRMLYSNDEKLKKKKKLFFIYFSENESYGVRKIADVFVVAGVAGVWLSLSPLFPHTSFFFKPVFLSVIGTTFYVF